MRRERFQIGADLVADIAIGGDAVGADDRQIDPAVLHEMATGIVRDHRMRDIMMAEFPGGERGALVAGTGLVDPDMNGETAIMRQVNWRGCGSEIDRRQPAGVAVRQYV